MTSQAGAPERAPIAVAIDTPDRETAARLCGWQRRCVPACPTRSGCTWPNALDGPGTRWRRTVPKSARTGRGSCGVRSTPGT